MSIKNVIVLGSTGSIGINTLKVIERFPNKFRVIGLTAYKNNKLLESQLKKFNPEYIAVSSQGIKYFSKHISTRKTKILNVDTELDKLVTLKKVDIIVIGIRGSVALNPFLSAVKCGKTVVPANKEALVIAGDIIMLEARRNGAKIIPIDSEQSAIFQCLEGKNSKELKRVLLTASGGSLLNIKKSKFNTLTVNDILNHPRWKMGKKITVDSASLMNKGFEVIEATRLFDLDVKDIQVVIHPEAIIHSMVEFIDGSIIAQLAITDMRLPIQYALTYPDRMDTSLKGIDFYKLNRLNFCKPDYDKFPSLSLAFYVAGKDGTLPCVLNAADEEAVEAFLHGKIKFTEIHKIVEKVVLKHRIIKGVTLKAIYEADKWAREKTKSLITSN